MTKPVIDKSNEIYERARRVIPAGTQTYSKGTTQFVDGFAPKYLARGKGAQVWDVDGNEYTDYIMACHPLILGYADPDVDAAVKAQLDLGSSFSLMNELMTLQGVYHGKFHFASSRATVWHVDDPFDYHILTIEELIDPDTCLAYPRRPYHERAIVPPEMIMPIFRQFGALRVADETIYLRAGSLNIINGMIGLNFSCDGSHYLPYDEFMNKGLDFWFGGGLYVPLAKDIEEGEDD